MYMVTLMAGYKWREALAWQFYPKDYAYQNQARNQNQNKQDLIHILVIHTSFTFALSASMRNKQMVVVRSEERGVVQAQHETDWFFQGTNAVILRL